MSHAVEHVLRRYIPSPGTFAIVLSPHLVSKSLAKLLTNCPEHGLSADTTRIQIHPGFHNLRLFTLGFRPKTMSMDGKVKRHQSFSKLLILKRFER